MTDQLAEIIGIAALTFSMLLVCWSMIIAAPPPWLRDWLDQKAEKRQKRRAERRKRKKSA